MSGKAVGGAIGSYHFAAIGPTAHAAAASDILGSLRNISTDKIIVIRHLLIGLEAAIAATAVGAIAAGIVVARPFTVDFTTGATEVIPTPDDSQMSAATAFAKAYIHTGAAAMTGGTATQASNRSFGGFVGVKVSDVPSFLTQYECDTRPIILRPSEGILFENRLAMPTAVTVKGILEAAFEVYKEGSWSW